MNTYTCKSNNINLAKFFVLIICLLSTGELIAQERIFSVEQLKKSSNTSSQMRMAGKRNVQTLDNEKIETFNNLYFNVKPALYYNEDNVNDATNGTYPAVIYIHPAAFSRLQADVKRKDFSTVQLVVIEGFFSGVLPDFFSEAFPELEFLVIKSKHDSGVILNHASAFDVVPAAFWEANPDAVLVYNNLPMGQ